MQDIVQLIAIGAVLAAFAASIVARVRRAWLVRAILLLLFGPAIPMAAIFGLGALFSPGTGTGLYNLVFGVMLIGTIIVVPWMLVCAIGVAIGLALRRKRPPEPIVPTTPVPAALSPSAPPQTHLAANAPKPHFSQTSPDGSIRIDIEPVEWARDQFAHTPRVIEAASGRIFCDLLGSDWDAQTSFPRDRYIWLGLRRYRSPGYLFAEFDLDADRYRIALSTLDAPEEEGPLGDVSSRLEHWWKRATAVAAADSKNEAAVSAPGPFAAWRIALAILVGAVAAIAGLTYLSITYDIDPPHVSTVPHIPRLGR